MDRSARIVEGLMEVETSLKGTNQCYVMWTGHIKGCFILILEGVVLDVVTYWRCTVSVVVLEML